MQLMDQMANSAVVSIRNTVLDPASELSCALPRRRLRVMIAAMTDAVAPIHGRIHRKNLSFRHLTSLDVTRVNIKQRDMPLKADDAAARLRNEVDRPFLLIESTLVKTNVVARKETVRTEHEQKANRRTVRRSAGILTSD